MNRIQFIMPDVLYKRAKALADHQGRTMTDILNSLAREYVEQEEEVDSVEERLQRIEEAIKRLESKDNGESQ